VLPNAHNHTRTARGLGWLVSGKPHHRRPRLCAGRERGRTPGRGGNRYTGGGRSTGPEGRAV